MNTFVPLFRPKQSQIQIDPTPKPCSTDEFNYPSFRLINKKARVHLGQAFSSITVEQQSDKPQTASAAHHLFATANSKGWFTAVSFNGSSYELIFSTLEELRSTVKHAQVDGENQFTPKRRVTLAQGVPIILVFALHDSRLLVGLEYGAILVYDTTQLFSAGTEQITPLVSLNTAPIRQIIPNPGVDDTLVDLVAVVYQDGTVQLTNSRMEIQAGWSTGDPEAPPVAVSWSSPKGKHLAIGLKSGDILTFALTNKTTVHKHIPPTSNGELVTLNWLGPGHTFRTGYLDSSPPHHIITLDPKMPTAIYNALSYPFVLESRARSTYHLVLPKWDVDSSTTPADEPKAVIVVADTCCTELDVIASSGHRWFQQSQENPISLPLDSSMQDTMLLALDVDLTDLGEASPIIYAYLNDGTIQAWRVEYSKPYAGMVTPQLSTSNSAAFGQLNSTPSVFGSSSPHIPPSSLAFGKPAFAATSAFGQTPNTTFGQFSAFGSSTQPSAFGQSNSGSTFGQTSQPGFPSTFAATSQPTNAFGGGSTGFGAFSSPPTTNAFLQGGFNSGASAGSPSSQASAPTITREESMSDSTPAFGGLSLGGGNSDSKPSGGGIFGTFSTTATNQAVSQEGSGILKPATGFGTLSSFQSASPFAPKPPSEQSSTPTFGQTSGNTVFGQNSQIGSPAPAFAQTGFGQPAFGQSGFGRSTFGQTAAPAATVPSTGGFSAFAIQGPTPLSSGGAQSGGGFSAFANKPSTSPFGGASTSPFATAVPPTSSAPASAFGTGGALSSGGFSAFANQGTPSVFGGSPTTSGSTPPQTLGQAPASSGGFSGGFSAFSNNGTNSGFGVTSAANPSAFGTAQNSSFVSPASAGAASEPAGTFNVAPIRSSAFPSVTAKPIIASPPSSPEPRTDGRASPTDESPPPRAPVQGGAFANLGSTSSAFKPATGFGAFGGSPSTSSPFFKKPEENKPSLSAFATALNSTPPKQSASATGTPAFGTTSSLGGRSSAFPLASPSTPTPNKPPASGGFSAFSTFSGAQSAFAAVSKEGQSNEEKKAEGTAKKSFAELLQSDTDPVKPKISSPALTNNKPEPSATSPFRPSVFPVAASAFPAASTPSKVKVEASSDSTPQSNAPKIEKGEGEKSTLHSQDSNSFGSLSMSSTASSFVEVDQGEIVDGPGSVEVAQQSDDEVDDDSQSFLGSDYESDPEGSTGSEEGSSAEQSDEGSAGGASPLAGSPPDPTTIPLPDSRSTSSTPQPEIPMIRVSKEKPSQGSEKTGEEPSTTPTGSPLRDTRQIPTKRSSGPTETNTTNQTSPSPSPPSPSPSPTNRTPLNLGLGLPKSRHGSSPLASTPVSGEDEADEQIKEPPKPAVSPRPVFGVFTIPKDSPVEESSGAPPSKRPKTPPLLSSFGKAATLPSPSVSTPSTSSVVRSATVPALSAGVSPKSSSAESLFGSTPTQLAKRSFAPSPSPGLADKPGDGPSAPSTPMSRPDAVRSSTTPNAFGISSGSAPNIFGAPTFTSSSPGPILGSLPLSMPPPFPASNVPPLAKTSTLGAFPKLTPQTKAIFGATSAPAASSPSMLPVLGSSSSLPRQPPPPVPEVTMAEGMQKQCAMLIVGLNKELEELRASAQHASERRVQLGKSAGGSHTKADLGDPSKWGLADAARFGQVLKQYERELENLKEKRSDEKRVLRELQSNMLKASTRKEEVSRFNKAQNDADFSKMLKARTLGPEHLETQTLLRKEIRAARDRIQKLEDHLQASKKKLTQASSGRPGLKAPSLDTVNRTYRNIDHAIDSQADEVAKLSLRIDQLDISAPGILKDTRDARLPDYMTKRPYNVTPPVAVTTAAALNAERSAQRLKKTLLALRKEPLLNTKAISAPAPPVAFATPHKPDAPLGYIPAFGFQTSITGPLFSPQADPQTPLPNWTLPEDNFSPSPTLPTRRGASGSGKKHSILPKRSPVISPPTGTISTTAKPFDWGPLPIFNNPPLTTLAANVKITKPTETTKV